MKNHIVLKKILYILLIIVVLIQLYRPEKNISTETPIADFLTLTSANDEISTLIKNSCYDCHSNNTKYPWYAEIAPISWWISGHVDHGKEELNFSEWSSYSEKKMKHKLKEIVEVLEEKEMPLESYIPMHPEAKLSDDQIQQLITWVKKRNN